MICLVQFGINKHLSIFSKTTNCTRPKGSCNFVSLWKNLLVLIYSKLHSKSCDYLYKFSSLHCFGQKLWTCNGAQANYRRMDAESFNLNLVKQKWNKMEIMNLGSPHLEQVLQYNWIPSYVSSAVVTSSIWRKNRTDPALHRCSFPMLSSHNASYVTDFDFWCAV